MFPDMLWGYLSLSLSLHWLLPPQSGVIAGMTRPSLSSVTDGKEKNKRGGKTRVEWAEKGEKRDDGMGFAQFPMVFGEK